MAKKPPTKNKGHEKKHPDELELGRMMKNVYESGYLDRNQAYRFTFLKGVLGGLGGVIGATIVVALIIWILSFFQQVPLLNRVVNKVTHTLQENYQKTNH